MIPPVERKVQEAPQAQSCCWAPNLTRCWRLQFPIKSWEHGRNAAKYAVLLLSVSLWTDPNVNQSPKNESFKCITIHRRIFRTILILWHNQMDELEPLFCHTCRPRRSLLDIQLLAYLVWGVWKLSGATTAVCLRSGWSEMSPVVWENPRTGD